MQNTPRTIIAPEVKTAAKALVLDDPTFGKPALVDVLLLADFAMALHSDPLGCFRVAVSTYLGMF